MKLLLRTPAPHPTESLLGFALRVSEMNGYDSPWHIFSLAGFTQGEIVSTGFKVNKLAAILGRGPEQFEQITYRAESGKKEFQLLGHRLGGSLTYSPLRLKRPALCPCCVEENGYIDAFWDLSSAIACPIHGTQMLDHCPACSIPLSWFRPGLLKCKCGENLRQLGAPNASTAEVELMRLLYAKLHHLPIPDSKNNSLPIRELWLLPLQSVLELLVAIGQRATTAGSAGLLPGTTNTTETAVEILSNWPANFHDFLRKLDQHCNEGGISIRKRFRTFYSSMFKHRRNAADFTFLRDEMLRFGSEEWGEVIVDPRMNIKLGENQRFLSRKKLAERINVDPRTLSKWAEKGRVNIKEVGVGIKKRFIADAAGFSKTIKTDVNNIFERQAAMQLELPTSVLRFLKSSRHYSPVHTPPYKGGYHELDLQNFYRTILDKSNEIGAPPNTPVLTLEYVMQETRFWSTNGKGEFVAAFLDGEIQSPGRLNQKISSILFYKADVEHFVQKSRAKSAGNTISLQEASQRIDCSSMALKALARDGYLEMLSGPSRHRITISSIEQLLSTHISLQAIARAHHSSTRKLHRLCIAQRIKTLRVPHEGTGETIFVSVNCADRVVDSLLDSRPTPKISAEKALGSYLTELQATGQLLPRRAGKPQFKAIALACGFERSSFYKNELLSQLLEKHQIFEAEKHGAPSSRTPFKALSDFLARLKVSSKALPIRGTRPNLKEIAKQCGFKRDVFYIDPTLREMLDKHLIEDVSTT